MWNEYYVHPSRGAPRGSDDSPIDGERVDLVRFPEFAKARWKNTTIEKGDCLFTPANLLHYVRSWSDDPNDPRTIALMTMYQPEGAKYDPQHCRDTPPYVTLSDYDTLWGEFPGSKAVPRCMNHIKMGYPNWKRFLRHLGKQEVKKEAFVKFWLQSADRGYSKKRVENAWTKFASEALEGSWTEKVFNSTALRNLARDVACAGEGLKGPERKLKDGESWDARNEYSLQGGGKTGYVDEKHEL